MLLPTLTLTHPHIHTLILTLMPTLSHSQAPLPPSHPHNHVVSLSPSNSHTGSVLVHCDTPHTVTLRPLSPSHSHVHALTLPSLLTLSSSHTCTHTFSLTHTVTLTDTHCLAVSHILAHLPTLRMGQLLFLLCLCSGPTAGPPPPAGPSWISQTSLSLVHTSPVEQDVTYISVSPRPDTTEVPKVGQVTTTGDLSSGSGSSPSS